MRLSLAPIAIAASLCLAAPIAGAQQHTMKQGESHDATGHGMSAWKEMDAFHAMLGTTFHPAQKGELAPLKANASTLAARARTWSESTPPQACATPDPREAVRGIAASASALAERVAANAPDAELTTAIGAIHDSFEALEKQCGPHHDMKPRGR